MASDVDQAWECRDKEDQARLVHQNPLRHNNKLLADENLRLKRLLRENGIAWSPVAQAHLSNGSSSTKRNTRSSVNSRDLNRPHIPMEIMLRILKFALTSDHPIIDPLSPLSTANLTEWEKSRGNQVAFHILTTCKALKIEGTRIFWTSNSFVFTTPQAVQNFAELGAQYRSSITHVTFRIIAKYFDDNAHRKHMLESTYHKSMTRSCRLKVHVRPRDTPLVRGGLRSYAWGQIVDFLIALRPPHDPKFHSKSSPRPRLLPSLVSLRLDLVNFSDTLLAFSGSEFHDATSHEFGCSLNELQVTGMPNAAVGMKASAELSGLLKDEGLYLDGEAAYLAPSGRSLKPLSGDLWCSRVVRACDEGDEDDFSDFELDTHDDFFSHHNHTKIGIMPPAPPEEGHPKSTKNPDSVVWKRVPVSRDSTERRWAQFTRYGGYEVRDTRPGSDDVFCPNCGELHPASLLDDSDDYFFDE